MARRASRRVPRYREIAEALRGELAEGAYPVGSVFPRELDLCERFGVSRFTIRNAMADLETAGLIERRKAIGTIVRALVPASAYVQSLSTPDDILQYPPETQLSPVEQVEVDANTELAAWFGVDVGDTLIRIGGVRTERNGRLGICWTDIYLRSEYSGVVDHIGKDARPVYRIVEDEYGESAKRVDVEMSACAVADQRAHQLRVQDGTPALRIVRIYTGADGRVFEVSVSEHPESRYTYKLEFNYETRGEPI